MNNSPASKILIVDDNTFYLSLLKTILREVEADIYMAASGNEALDLINENDFALAILDIQMPEIDGFQLARHIRKMQDRDLVPIIFLTAYLSDDIQMFKGYDNGAIDYLTKPVNKTVFISKVKNFLELDKQKRNLILINKSIQESKFELEKKKNEIEMQNEILRIAQKETEESRKKYIKLYDFAPSGYLTINKEAKIFEINIKGAKLLGSEPNQILSRNFKDFIDNELQAEFNRFLSLVFGKKSNSGCELKLIPILGNVRYIFLEGALIDDKSKCLLSIMDVTDQKETQIALKASEELYHSLLKTSPDGILISNLEGKITEASDIAKALLGSNQEVIEGKYINEFIPNESEKIFFKLYKETLKEGRIQNQEIRLIRSDKTEFSGEISASLIRGNTGELTAFMADIRDISERKLIEKQLRHTERMAGIGELATGMAHEINQPLNVISLSTDNIMFSLENNALTETYLKTKLNKVFDNITRIKKIIDHVRTFSRDQDDFVQVDFDINASIQNGISMISEQISHKGIKITFTADKTIPVVKGNAYRFEQVILNLLANAKDAIEEKRRKNLKNFKKRIDISTNLVEKQINIEINDNGIGIKSEHVEKVLLPFFTTKEPGRGTGLGLSISYGIIKELNGEIEIQSTPQIGTNIKIIIPVTN